MAYKMIFDRTQSDAEEARKIRSKLQSGYTISDEEIALLDKGTLNIDTLNRIENKQTELYNLFIQYGYFCQAIQNKTWEYGDFFEALDFSRIIENNEKLRSAFFDFVNSPKKPKEEYNFSNINDIEKLLYDLDVNYQYMVSNIRECGTFESGDNT